MKRARLNVVLSEDNYNKITALSERWGVSKSNVVGVALGQYFDGLEMSKDAAIQALKAVARNEFNELAEKAENVDVLDLVKNK